MIKKGDYVYLYHLDFVDKLNKIGRGLYKVVEVSEAGMRIYVDKRYRFYFIEEGQYYKVVPNKINKLLYKGLK